MRYKALFALIILSGGLFIASCSNSDCQLNNTVSLKISFCNSDAKKSQNVTDTLSIFASANRDTLLMNRLINFNSVELPMSNTYENNVYLLRFTTQEGFITDTLYITQTNTPYFESLECNTAHFHTIKSARVSTRTPSEIFPTALDSIVILNPQVNYDSQANLKIYFSTH